MSGHCSGPSILTLLILCLQTVSGVHLSHVAALEAAHGPDWVAHEGSRTVRQTIFNPQLFVPPLTSPALNVPIPVNLGFYPGVSGPPLDQCARDQIVVEGICRKILSSDGCRYDEIVIVDPETNTGSCAPRLCPPNRVFVHTTQQCHDPRDSSLCPPGRQLFSSAFGTAVCSCPVGFVEGDDDLDDDVCEPILRESLSCLADQVFWFTDFSQPPQCVPDPCNGLNLNRPVDSLPYVPSRTGECFQIGQTRGACPEGLIYALLLEQQRGECLSLKDAGYNVFTKKEMMVLKKLFGPIQSENTAPPIPTSGSGYGIQDTHTQNNLVTHSGNMYNQNNFVTPTGNMYNQNNFVTPTGNTYNQNNFVSPTGNMYNQNNVVTPTGNMYNQNNVVTPNGNMYSQNNLVTQNITPIQSAQPIRHHSITLGSTDTVVSNYTPFSQGISQKPLGQQNNHQANQAGSTTIIQKPICTFIQSAASAANPSGGIQGHKVCSDVQPGGLGGQQSAEVGVGPGNTYLHSPEVFHGGPRGRSFDSYGYRLGKSLGLTPIPGRLVRHVSILPKGETIHHFPRYPRNINENEVLDNLHSVLKASILQEKSEGTKVLSRRKRAPLPHASPSNVFDARLLGCRSGAQRDMNAKCRNTVLPAQTASSRNTRAAPPIPPRAQCPAGMSYNIRRQCVSSGAAQNSIIGRNLG